MKKDQKQVLDADRRNFLRGSAATGLGVAAAVSLPASIAGQAEQAEEETDKGYRLTSHVLEYYKTLAS